MDEPFVSRLLHFVADEQRLHAPSDRLSALINAYADEGELSEDEMLFVAAARKEPSGSTMPGWKKERDR